MGLALDTVLGSVTNSVTLTNATIAPGNSSTVRSFPSTGYAKLENVLLKGGQAATVSIRSPLLHDDVRGIQFTSAQAPTVRLLPTVLAQQLKSQDQLAVLANSGAANSTAFAYTTYYSDLPGASARLHSWADIAPMIEQVKPMEVDVTAAATVGQWNDTVITTTENLLKANRDYAVLGYVTDVACLCVAFSGTDTSNMRVSGPGSPQSDFTSDFWVRESAAQGTPHIPVFNSANKDTTFVSVADNAASTAVKVQLVLALLSESFTG